MDHDEVVSYVDGLDSKPVCRRRFCSCRDISLVLVFLGGFVVTVVLLLQFLFPVVCRQDDDVGLLSGSGIGDSVVYVGDDDIILRPFLYENFTPPSNSFGMGSTVFKTVNWSFWQGWFNDSIVVWLEKSPDGKGHWSDCSNLLVVDKDWNEVNVSVKLTFSWVSDEDSFYRVSYKLKEESGLDTFFDESAKQQGSNRFLLNCSITESESYDCVWDWSDYKNSAEYSTTSFSKEIISNSVSNKPEFFWTVVTDSVVKKGSKFVIDPTFGITTKGSNTLILSDPDDLYTSIAILPYDSTIYNISGYMKHSNGISKKKARFIIYNSSFAFVAITNESSTTIDAEQWYTMPISTGSIELDAGKYFIGVMHSGDSSNYPQIWYYTDGYSGRQLDNDHGQSYPNYPDPMVNDTFYAGDGLSIYCTYILKNPPPSFKNEYPISGSYNQSFSTIFNVTVSDEGGNDTTVDWYLSTDNITWEHVGKNTSHTANTSCSVDLTGHLTDYQTTYYLKVTTNDIISNTSGYYNFETTPYRTLFFNDTFPNDNWILTNSNMTINNDGFVNTTSDSSNTLVMSWFDGFEESQSHNIPMTSHASDYWSDGNGEESWWYGEGYTTSSSTGCGVSANRNPYGGDDVLFTESSSTPLNAPPADYIIESSSFSLNSTDNMTIDFYYHMYGAGDDFDYCSVQINHSGGWDTLWNLTDESHTGYADADPWDNGLAYIESGANYPYTGNHKLRFYVMLASTYLGDFCLDDVWVNKSLVAFGDISSYLISKNITRTEANWDTFKAHVTENESNATFSILDEYGNTLLSNLDGSSNDISSITNGTVRIRGDFNNTLSLTSWNISWSAGGAPWTNTDPVISGEHPTNQSSSQSVTPIVGCTLSDSDSNHTFNVTFASNYTGSWVNYQTNSSVTNSGKVNYSFTGASSYNTLYYWKVFCHDGFSNISEIYEFTTLFYNWYIVDSSINGIIRCIPYWNLVDNSISGVIHAPSVYWNLVDNSISGIIRCSPYWNLVDNSISGVIRHTVSWDTVDNSISGVIHAPALEYNWNLVSNSINGVIHAPSVSWNTIDDTINGTITSNITAYYWNTIDNSINGVIRCPSVVVNITVNNIYPINNSNNIPLQPKGYLTLNSSKGYVMNISWYLSGVLVGCNSNVTNGTVVCPEVFYLANTRNQNYNWSISVYDGCSYVNRSYSFTTESLGGGSGRPVSLGLILAALMFAMTGIVMGIIGYNRKK